MTVYSFSHGYSINDMITREKLQAFRNIMGGSAGLEKESDKINQNDLNLEKKSYFANPQEILDFHNEQEIDAEVRSKNSLARPWWDSGANEGIFEISPVNDENLIITSRTSEQALSSNLQPRPNAKAAEQNQRSIKQLLEEQRDKRIQRSRRLAKLRP